MEPASSDQSRTYTFGSYESNPNSFKRDKKMWTMQLSKRLVCFLMTSSIVWSVKISAQEIPKPDFTSLTRVEREKIAVCFQENEACHATLKNLDNTPVQDDWGVLISAMLVAMIGGMIVDHQIWNH